MIVPFHGEDLNQLDVACKLALSTEQVRALEQASSWTAMDDAGKVIGCAGVVRMWQGRYAAWAFLGSASRSYMRELTKATRAFLDTLDARRVELTVEQGFKQGHQWAKMLGFKLETPEMPGYGANGAAHAMYVRMKP